MECVSLVGDVTTSYVEDEAKVNMVLVVNADLVAFMCLCYILDK